MSNRIITNETFEFNEGYEKITKIKKIKNDYKPSFRMIGDGKKNRQGISMNLVKEMSNMSAQELWLMNKLEESLDNKNISKIKRDNLSEPEKRKLQLGFKLLHEKDLVRRVKKEHYMINPMLIIPKEWKERYAEYLQLKSIKDK